MGIDAMNAADEFRKMREDFRLLRIEDATDEVGDHHVALQAAAAGKLVYRCITTGLLRAPSSWAQVGQEFLRDAAEGHREGEHLQWYGFWQAVCFLSHVEFPDRVPAAVGMTRLKLRDTFWNEEEKKRGYIHTGGTKRRDWRMRARQYADVCGLLAELICPQEPGLLPLDVAEDAGPPPKASRPHDSEGLVESYGDNYQRDRFIYQCMKDNQTDAAIIEALAENAVEEHWMPLDDARSVQRGGEKFARHFGLHWPVRKRGRKSGKSGKSGVP
jgi:hypothetical protein